MRIVRLEDRYCYLPANNLLVNEEVLNKFETYLNNNKINLNDFEVDENFLRKQIKESKQIILGITEGCNLRCSYCVYNDNYLYENKLSGKHLDFKIAKKGLEYIFGFVKDRFDKTFRISFYGGEPFIKFDLMKKIVAYSRTLFKGWELFFGVTTNATLLTDEIIEYLLAEEFNITISLDGPAPNQNSKRVYMNGKGTFNDVWGALVRIKNRDAEYFSKKISFNIVHSPDQSLFDIFHFFTENELINMNRVLYGQVIAKDTDYYEKINYDESRISDDYMLIFEKIKAKFRDSIELKPFEKKIYEDHFVNRSLNIIPDNIYFGTCFFNTRLFMDVDGKFHICESINNTFPLGDVWRGFNFNRMVELVRGFLNIRKKYCSDCDINYLCKPCYIAFASNGTFDLDKDFCSRSKEGVLKKIRRQIRFEEYIRTINEKDKSKVFQFHQFISTVTGYANTAIVDFVTSDIYHVPNIIMERFGKREYEKIPEFIKDAKESDLIISVDNNTWIPKRNISKNELLDIDEIGKNDINLCIEVGVDLSLVKHQISNFNITRINYYGSGSQRIEDLFPGIEIFYESLDYLKCSNLSVIKEDDFVKIDEEFYNFSQVCNNCWGHKISITKDGNIRPCIYSNIIIDSLKNLSDPKTIEKIKSYWYITKDKVEKCMDCELRYFCIDCREVAQRKGNGNLYASNPHCKYNPYTGEWQDDE